MAALLPCCGLAENVLIDGCRQSLADQIAAGQPAPSGFVIERLPKLGLKPHGEHFPGAQPPQAYYVHPHAPDGRMGAPIV